MPTIVTPPLLLDSSGVPANGTIYARATSPFPYLDDVVTTAGGLGVIRNGVFYKPGNGGLFSLPPTPVSVAFELVVVLTETHDGRAQKHITRRTVSVPDTATATWLELVDVVADVTPADFIIPPWIADLLASYNAALDATDALVAGLLGTPASATGVAFAAGYDIILAAGQSNSLGYLSPVEPAIDLLDSKVFFYDTAPASMTFHTIQPAAEPLQGPFNTNGTLSHHVAVGRRWAARTGRRVLIVPLGVGGTGFRANGSHNARWLVGEVVGGRTNLATLSVTETLAAVTLGGFGSRVVGVLWNQGEADRDIVATEATYTADFDALVALWRTNFGANTPVVTARQSPEKRAADGTSKAGVDDSQLDTPGRVPFTAVVHPPAGVMAVDGLHYLAKGQRRLGRLYDDGLLRAALNNPALAAPAITGVKAVSSGTSVTVSWDPATGGRTESIRVRYVVGGVTTTATVKAGEVAYTFTAVSSVVAATAGVTAMATAGDGDETIANVVPYIDATGPITGLSASFARAHGLRTLVSGYAGPLVRVRRSSDSTELDINASGFGLDTTALLAFCGANSGYVVTWYDQSGNARHRTQATAGSQPRLVNAGVVEVTATGKPAIYGDGGDTLVSTVPLLYTASGGTIAAVVQGNGGTNSVIVGEGSSAIATGYYIGARKNSPSGYLGTVIAPSATIDLNAAGAAPTPFVAGASHQFIVWDDGAAVWHYVNGSNTYASAYTRTTPDGTRDRSSLFGLVRSTTGNWFTGHIREEIEFVGGISEGDRNIITANQLAYA